MKWFSKSDDNASVKFVNNTLVFEGEEAAKVTIPVSDFASVLLNGTPVNGVVDIAPSDKFEVIYSNNIVEEPVVTFNFTENLQKTEVSIEKTVSYGKYYTFKDIPNFGPTINFEISLEPLLPEPTPFDEIEALIRHNGYNAEFIEERILLIANATSNAQEVVVKAIPPIPGKPAGFELINGIEDGKIINENQFFAEYVNEVEGKPGKDIFGIDIPSEDLFFFPDFGDNVLVEDRGLMALKQGRLVFNKNSITIIEETNLAQSFNYEDGVVEFDGDYVIDGDIKEGGQIKCTGNLTVKGGVFDSYVFADGNLIVEGNVDQSVVYAGFSKIAARQIEFFALQYLEIFERVMFESSFFAADGSDYSEKTKSLELAKSEFLAIQQTIDPFTSLVEQFSNTATIELYANFASVVSNGTKVVLNDQSSSEDIRTEMEKFYEIIKVSKGYLVDDLGTFKLSSCNNSHIFSYNDTELVGSGSFQSVIESNGSINLFGNAIATSLKSEKFISVNEINAGNENGVKLIVKRRDGYIKAKLIDSDVILEISNKKFVTDDELNNAEITYTGFPK